MKRRTLIALPALLLARGAHGETTTKMLHGAKITIESDSAIPSALRAMIDPWISKCADAVSMYYGKFPVPEVDIRLALVPGAGIKGGQTFPGEVPRIRIRVGGETSESQFMHDDWVMVHEMIHLAFPWLNMQHNWMAEGIAVYVESIARVQAGHLSPAQIWHDFVTAMPKGLPKDGDGGLDDEPSWGRTYWGGAMFCLVCDVRIRQQTENRFGLQHALRAINAERDFRKEWPFRETLEIGDKATGRAVLINTYDEMRDTAVSPDLAALWRDLGVQATSSGINFDNTADLSGIRQAITTPPA